MRLIGGRPRMWIMTRDAIQGTIGRFETRRFDQADRLKPDKTGIVRPDRAGLIIAGNR